MLGSRAPASLKLFLTTVAIVDDMGAVAIIALFYTDSLNMVALGAAAAIWLVMLALGRLGGARYAIQHRKRLLVSNRFWRCVGASMLRRLDPTANWKTRHSC